MSSIDEIFGETAGFFRRLIALVIDGFFLSIILVPLSLTIYGEWYYSATFTPMSFIEIIYFMTLPLLWPGYTIGKRLLKIRIERIGGRMPDFFCMFARVVIAFVFYTFTLGVGTIVSAIMVIARDDNRAIHDLIADTYVRYDTM
ncbi:RDD family protein [Alkalibacillus flavidus]|uniref:RDD family protein n=1 Tax=Alkalibacillus flavidus TaxID=546021 RepID=UPI0033937355